MTPERQKYFAKMSKEELDSLTFKDFLVDEIEEFKNNTPLSPEEKNNVDLFFIQGLKASAVAKIIHVSRATAYRMRKELSLRMRKTLQMMLYKGNENDDK